MLGWPVNGGCTGAAEVVGSQLGLANAAGRALWARQACVCLLLGGSGTLLVLATSPA